MGRQLGKTYVDKGDEPKRHLLPLRCTDEDWRKILEWHSGSASARAKAILQLLKQAPGVAINKSGFLHVNDRVLYKLGIDLEIFDNYSYTLKHNSNRNALKITFFAEIGESETIGKVLYIKLLQRGGLSVGLNNFLKAKGINLTEKLSGIPVKYGNLSIEIPLPKTKKD